jgi:hypothetical protein
MGIQPPVFCSGHPIDMDMPYILSEAAENGNLEFKEQVTFFIFMSRWPY